MNISSTPAKEVAGKYCEVVKVWTKTDYLSAGCRLLLREKESGDEVCYNPSRYPLSMTCTRHCEKLKRFVGQTFLSIAKRALLPLKGRLASKHYRQEGIRKNILENWSR